MWSAPFSRATSALDIVVTPASTVQPNALAS